ncbi:MAG: NUDIX domain-containing protein [Beijerinckiaceae bacterium]|nr:NUDIX domain-containing protein [Beijerinckiaceae bacterium]
MTGEICIRQRNVLACGHGVLERVQLERRQFDGHRQSLTREIYDSGDGAAILLYDPKRSLVVLVRQFRAPAYLKEGRECMIEVCAGRLEGEDAESCIIKEAGEETGFLVRNPRRLFEAYMSPGCFAERLTFFAAEYSADSQSGKGGGRADEGEDIEVLELTLDEALAMIGSGEIADAKTILLLQYAKLAGLLPGGDAAVLSQAESM